MREFGFDINSISGKNCGKFVSLGQYRHATRRRDDWEMIYVASGTLYMFEEDREFEVPKGCALILKAGLIHGGSRDYDPDLQFYWFHFFADETETDAVRVKQLCRPSQPERVVELLQWYMHDLTAERDNQRIKDTIARFLLLELQDIPDENKEIPPLAAKVKEYIQENVTEKLNTSVIAKKLGFNPEYTERVFKKAYGVTVTQHIRTVRVNNAKRLLGYTTLTVSEIAEFSGFSSKEDFCRVFKAAVGQTPTAYRKSKVNDRVYST